MGKKKKERKRKIKNQIFKRLKIKKNNMQLLRNQNLKKKIIKYMTNQLMKYKTQKKQQMRNILIFQWILKINMKII